MRTGLGTIQQTLTPEAASVLNQAISEASRRNHGQTTPLHVAATLLASPSGFLRLACIRSHPNSSHPLQCRALELCFSVALDRLPASSQKEQHQPPISNALMAALKRAQAHQRRGCPEQQQQPLLAVKVELEQLIISILDDPSVSRVMREASFSSPAVKNAIEQSLSSCSSSSQIAPNPSLIGLGFRTVPNQYLNPRLQQPQVGRRCDEVKQVVEILMRSRRRNPVLVGDSMAEAVMKELLRRIVNKDIAEGILKNVDVISFDPHSSSSSSSSRIKELGEKIESRLALSDGVVVDLGDLRWVVEQPAGGLQPEPGRAGVVEMGKLLSQFGGGFPGRVWLISRATCETYMRCQVYHRSMENDWDLQAVPIPAKAPPLPPLSNPRFGMSNGSIRGSSIDLCSSKSFLTRQASNSPRATHCCSHCKKSCEQEIAKLAEVELSSSSSGIIRAESAKATLPDLPKWLQNAAHEKYSDHSQVKDEEVLPKQGIQELQMKWANACLLHHPHFHQTQETPMLNLYNSDIIAAQPRLQAVNKSIGGNLRLNLNAEEEEDEEARGISTSPVRTDLALGSLKTTSKVLPIDESESAHKKLLENDRSGCISLNGFHAPQGQKSFLTDVDLSKKLLKGLMQKVWWQQEAVSSVVTAVSHCRSGLAKTPSGAPKGDLWLMFTGPDRVGKMKMARVLADLVCGGTDLVTLSLGSRRDDSISFRGKTALDRIAETVKRNPFSLIVLEDVDEVDAVICGSIKRAMERGRLVDSHNRDVSLGNVIFILTAQSLPQNFTYKATAMDDEEKLRKISCGSWQLRLSAYDRTGKRQANHLCKEDRQPHAKPRTETAASGLSFDLNLAAADDGNDDSRNSSGLTMDHEDENLKMIRGSLIVAASSSSRQLLDSVDEAVVFKAVDFDPIRRDISTSIAAKFSAAIGKQASIEVDDEVVEKILGGVWFGETALEEWEEKVLVPSFRTLKAQLPSSPVPNLLVRLEPGEDSGSRGPGEWLPGDIRVAVDDLEFL